MRSSIAILVLVCAMAMPAFCQKEQEPGPDSSQARELKACGPQEKEVKYSADTDKSQHPTGTPAADTALIYVIRSTKWYGKDQTMLAVDGEWKGVNRGNNYFFFMVKPGEHYFCSLAGNRSVLVLTVEAGKTYYLAQTMYPGKHSKLPSTDLKVMGDDDGQKELAEAHPSTWQVK